MFDGKRLLVIGGTGSLGRAFVRRVLTDELGRPEKIIVLSRGLLAPNWMSGGERSATAARLETRFGDVRVYDDVLAAVRGADVVVHAAAVRDLPACELAPGKAVLTNCMGADNLARAVQESGYQATSVVATSTAKACAPTSVMGMTKALEERIFVAASAAAREAGASTRFFAIRFGNVLGTTGSVVPLFLDQITQGGPVTVTDAQMTRFVTTIDDAVDALLDALRSACPGEVVVPRTASARVVDLARSLVGGRAVQIVFTGTRPGERTHELLVSADECPRTFQRGGSLVVRPLLRQLQVVGDDDEREVLSQPYSSLDNLADGRAVDALLERAGLRRNPAAPRRSAPTQRRHSEEIPTVSDNTA